MLYFFRQSGARNKIIDLDFNAAMLVDGMYKKNNMRKVCHKINFGFFCKVMIKLTLVDDLILNCDSTNVGCCDAFALF